MLPDGRTLQLAFPRMVLVLGLVLRPASQSLFSLESC